MPCRTLLLTLLVAFLTVAPAVAQTDGGGADVLATPGTVTPPGPAPTPTAGSGATYVDPEGRFTVPIPTGWRAETVDGVGILRSPEGDITVSLLVVEGEDPAAAIGEAWRRVDPAFDREPEQVVEPPPPPGVDRVVLATYDSGEVSGEVVQGVGQLANGAVFVQLYRGDLGAVARRSAQLQIIDTGFAIAGVERTDLAGVPARPLTPELLAELDAYVVETMERLRIPGAAVAVVQDGAVVHERGFGVRELGGSEPVTPDTLMMIGSATKSLTTMLMATLVDEGLLSWDTPVVDLLPGFAVADPELTERLTVRNLVCACTGVPRRDLELLFNADELSAEDVVASLVGFEFFTGFGEAFQYSNQMVAVGGYAAAVAAGGDEDSLYDAYAAALQERVLGPIGMDDSTLSFAEATVSPERATPHGPTLDGGFAPIPLAGEEAVVPVAPSGGLWSTARDMARYAITQLNRGVAPDGTRVVSAENLEETWQPQVPVTAETSYGLGWFVDEWKGRRLLHHGGNTFGFSSDLAFMPDAGIGVVVLTNGRRTNLFNLAVRYRVLELAFDLEPEFDREVVFGVEEIARQVAETRGSLGDLDPDAVQPFLGTYASPALGEVTLALETTGQGGPPRLVLDVGEFATALLPTADPPGGGRYLSVDPTFQGLRVDLRTADRERVLVVVAPTGEEYILRPVGTTLATPAATPIAMPNG